MDVSDPIFDLMLSFLLNFSSSIVASSWTYLVHYFLFSPLSLSSVFIHLNCLSAHALSVCLARCISLDMFAVSLFLWPVFGDL